MFSTLLRRISAVMAVCAVIISSSVVLQTLPAHASLVREFTSQFKAQTTGDIVITGNGSLTCADSDPCPGAQDGTNTSTREKNNNNFHMVHGDFDDDANTFNSSMASLNMPAGSEVLFAGLYWGGTTKIRKGSEGKVLNKDQLALIGQMKLRVPGGDYQVIEATEPVDRYNGDLYNYSSYADITDIVKKAGAGQYWGANIQASTGIDGYGGWAIVVAYENADLPFRDLNVYSGYLKIDGDTTSHQITVDGFVTPPTGPVKATIGAVVFEGDNGYTGDSLEVNGQLLSDNLSEEKNFFNGTVAERGVRNDDRNPAYPYSMQIDAKTVSVPAGMIPNGAKSADIVFATDWEHFFPTVMTAAIDLYEPSITPVKEVVNLSSDSEKAKRGDILEYRVVVENTGDANAANVVFTDSVPEGSEYVPNSLKVTLNDEDPIELTDDAGDDTGEVVDGDITVRVGEGADAENGGLAANGDSYLVTFHVVIETEFPDEMVPNTANVSYFGQDTGNSFNAESNKVETPVVSLMDLTIAKTGPTEVKAGETITWTITAGNNGPKSAHDISITDEIPDGLTYVSASGDGAECSEADGTVICTIPEIAKDATYEVTITATVPPNFEQTPISNAASISAAEDDDSNPDNNSASVETTVAKSADLRTEKSVDPATVTPGEEFTWTVTVTNDGPSNADKVTLNDAMPDGVTPISVDDTDCVIESNEVNCTWGTLAPDAAKTVVITAKLASDWTGKEALTNTATASSTTPDPNEDNNSGSADVTPGEPQADLVITKRTITDPVEAGKQISYELVVTNNGPSQATDVVIADSVDGDLSNVKAESDELTCEVSGNDVSCSLATLAVDATVKVKITADLDSDRTEDLGNTATVGAATADPDETNNSAEVTDPVDTSADLAIVKTSSDAKAGEDITYTIEVTNNGPATSRNVVVTDTLPAELEYVSADNTGCEHDAAAGTLTCPMGDIASGDSATFHVTMHIPSGVKENTEVANSASVSSDTTDPDGTNDSSSVTDQVQAEADLAVTKTADAAVAGSDMTYSITVTNNGSADAVNATLTDPLPTEVSFVSVTTDVGTCEHADGDITCDFGTLAPDAVVTIDVVVNVDADLEPGTELSNTAQASSDTKDPDETNNAATAKNPVEASADLSIEKTADVTAPAPGESVVWTLTIANNGPSSARNVSVSDTMPDGFTVVNVDDPCVADADQVTVTCDWDKFVSGAVVEVKVESVLASDHDSVDELVNTASVSSDTPDPDTDNNAGSAAVTPQAPSADLAVTKVTLTDPVEAGKAISYQITVENLGPSQASAVVVSDTLSADLIDPEFVADSGECELVDSELSCAIDTLAVGEKAVVTVNATLAASATGEASNSVSVSSDTADPNEENNSSSVTDPVIAKADLAIVKTASQAVAGEDVTYVLTVTNHGPADAVNVVISDDLPEELTFVSVSDESCEVGETDLGDVLACGMDRLANGESKEIIVTMHLPEDLTDPTSVVNNAMVGAYTDDPDPDNNSTSATIMTEADADLALVKVGPESVVAGEYATWSVTVSNNGPSSAVNTVVVDQLPEGVDQDVTVTSDTGECEVEAGTITCQLGTIAANGQALIEIKAMVSGDLTAEQITNVATVSSDTNDPAPDNNTGRATTTLTSLVDLYVIKVGQPDANAGEDIRWDIEVTNHGPSVAQGVTVTDMLPDGVTFLKAEGIGDTQVSCEVNGQEVTCLIPQIEVGETVAFAIEVASDKDMGEGVIVNHVSVTSLTEESAETMDDNSDQFSTEISAHVDPPAPKPDPEPKPAPGKMPSTGTATSGPLALAAAMLGLGALMTTRRRMCQS